MADGRDPANQADALTEREQEILACLAEGLSNHEIARRLHLAHPTVKWYNAQIYSKLGVNSREEAVAQAQARGLLGEPVADDAPALTRHNLPLQTTPFIGREQELAGLARLLADPDIRLVTILAPGGMGKTRLALAAAEQQLRHFPDGVFFVPLAPLSAPEDIVTTIADHVDFSFFGSAPPKRQLLDYFRDRNLLLVLDNFEHLLDGTPLVSELIRTAPAVKVLATSREKLNLTGETVFMLFGLEFPTWETPEDALAYAAVRLFMQSARRARPDFDLQAADLDYLARICRLTAGMPLAIVLAAGWLDMLTLERIADEIQQGIDILETERRDVPERQRSVRATFNNSWGRLSEAERSVFMKLSVFRGGFTSEAAEAVAGARLRQLRTLVDKALVGVSPTGRYEVHELLRQFAEEQLLEAGESETVQQAHSAYYMEFMAERDEDVKGRRQLPALQEIRVEGENLKQAWAWAAAHRHYAAIHAALDCLVNTAEMNATYHEAQPILAQAKATLQPAAGETPHPVWDALSVRLERVNFMVGLLPDGPLLREILDRTKARQDAHEVGYCHWPLGDYYGITGDTQAWFAHFEQNLMLHREIGADFYTAHALVGIHGGYWAQAKYDESLACLFESVRIRRQIGDVVNLQFSLMELGFRLQTIGRLGEAEAYLDEAIAIQDATGVALAFADAALRSLKVNLALWRGDQDGADRWLRQIAPSENHFTSTLTDAGRSAYWALTGDYERALEVIQPSWGRTVWPDIEQYVAWSVALAACGLGDDSLCRQAVARVLLLIRDQTKSRTHQQLCLPIAAVLAARVGHAERAVEFLGLASSAPKELTGWMVHWQLLTDLQRDLEADLGAEAYAALLERGAQLDLTAVVEQLLAEYSA